MTSRKIKWKNIYYMISYCVDELRYFEDGLIDVEDLNNTNELLATMLINSFEIIYRNGYIKKYKRETIITDKPHGKINIAKSLQLGVYNKGKLVCEVDTLNINNKLNQVIKLAFSLLINSNKVTEDTISNELMTKLYKCREKLREVQNIQVVPELLQNMNDIPEWYKPIYAVCKLIINDWLALDKTGDTRLLELNNRKRLWYIWEKFVRNLIEKEITPNHIVEKPSYKMSAKKSINPDILIHKEEYVKAIVADCKWYEKTDIINANMQQVIAYGEIISDIYKDKETTSLLLYASDTETHLSDFRDKNDCKGRFSVEEWQINVNQDFESIKQDIKNIILKHLNNTQE